MERATFASSRTATVLGAKPDFRSKHHPTLQPMRTVSIFCSLPMIAMTAMPGPLGNISPGKPDCSTSRNAGHSESLWMPDLLGPDLGTLHVVEVLSFDPDQFHRRLALRRMHCANVVELYVAWMHRIGPHRLDQR